MPHLSLKTTANPGTLTVYLMLNRKSFIIIMKNFLGILSIENGSNRLTTCEHFNMLESLQSHVFFIFEVNNLKLALRSLLLCGLSE